MNAIIKFGFRICHEFIVVAHFINFEEKLDIE
jgi:hypothetical protein